LSRISLLGTDIIEHSPEWMFTLKQAPFALTLLFIASTLQASANDIESRLLDCRTISNKDSRTSCYDQIADSISPPVSTSGTPESQPSRVETPAVTAPLVTAPLITPLPATPPVQEQIVQPIAAEKTAEAEALFGKPDEAVDEIVKEKLKIESLTQIRSPVVKIQPNHVDELIVYLENGQVWKQKGDGGVWKIKVGEILVISKASLGSFLMKAEGRKKSIRAERLR
jgi:hypothetical protein